ncbi:MAG: extracellular solute-binding protein [Holosporales bacterium]|jgi:microcin C transport system substrate-binding protein
MRVLLVILLLFPFAAWGDDTPFNPKIKNIEQPTSFAHGLSMHGDLKYPPGFTNFEYVNPDAPKGGTLVLAALGTYDSLNPFIVRGLPAAGIGELFDTLLASAQDEPFSAYGLIAEAVRTDAARTFVEFRLRPQARFSNGTPIRPEDVIFSFHTLRDQGRPSYRAYYSSVAEAKKLDDSTVRFEFKPGMNRELPLILGQMPILSEKYYNSAAFDKVTLQAPLGSGPYQVAALQPGRSITYQRVADYWAKDLPVNRGRNNFDTIRYDYYRDSSVALEAFKAGAYDFRLENIAKNWANAYDSPIVKIDSVKREEIKREEVRNIKRKDIRTIKREEIRHENVAGMQGFFFNLRNPLFADRAVREAFILAFDFESANKSLFFNSYTRSLSYFSNSELAATGFPTDRELSILKPLAAQIPREVLYSEIKLPTTATPEDLRLNLKRAADILKQAGWIVYGNQLIGKDGKPFEFEILIEDPTFERVIAPYLQNLQRLGIKGTIRVLDAAQYQQRLDNYQYDIIIGTFGQSLSPGNEQRGYWHSTQADVPGGNNILGVQNPAIDTLVERIITAPDRESLLIAVKALDRVLFWNYYVVPQWHTNSYRIAWWDKFERPNIRPRFSLGFPDTWWSKKPQELP